jgi:hypothetical protein
MRVLGAWELGIYKGKDKRATSVIKKPGVVRLKVSLTPVLVSSDDDGGKDQQPLAEETIYRCNAHQAQLPACAVIHAERTSELRVCVRLEFDDTATARLQAHSCVGAVSGLVADQHPPRKPVP